MNIRPFEKPAVEPCNPTILQEPSTFAFFEQPIQNGRLIPRLRQAAQDMVGKTKSAIEILTEAAIAQCQGGSSPLNVAMPLADLTVTGRAAFSDFSSTKPQAGPIQVAVHTFIGNQPGITDELISKSVGVVLDRAYSVAWFLRGQSARGNLGWIAVSAEDDPPQRPVNVSATAYPQYDLMFETPNALGQMIAVQTRFMIATGTPPTVPPVVPPVHALPPPLQEPVLPPNDRIILCIPGSDSRLEEVDLLVKQLVQTSGFSVISMDLPGSGYGNPIEHTAVGQWNPVLMPLPPGPVVQYDLDKTVKPVLLAFLEQFVVNFVAALRGR